MCRMCGYRFRFESGDVYESGGGGGGQGCGQLGVAGLRDEDYWIHSIMLIVIVGGFLLLGNGMSVVG